MWETISESDLVLLLISDSAQVYVDSSSVESFFFFLSFLKFVPKLLLLVMYFYWTFFK